MESWHASELLAVDDGAWIEPLPAFVFPVDPNPLFSRSPFTGILQTEGKRVNSPLSSNRGVCEGEGFPGSPVRYGGSVEGGFFGYFSPGSWEGVFIGVDTAGDGC